MKFYCLNSHKRAAIYKYLPESFTKCVANFHKFNSDQRVTNIKTDLPKSLNELVSRVDMNFTTKGVKNMLTFDKNILQKTFPSLNQLHLNLNNDLNLTKQLGNFLKKSQFIDYLNIENIEIDQSSGDVFDSLGNLKYLELTFSNFSQGLPKNLFYKLKQLKLLTIDQCELVSLDEKAFEFNENLEVLILNGNKIEDLPGNIFNSLTNLKELCLRFNKIEEFPLKIFSKLVNLKKLAFYGNKVSVLSSIQFKQNVNLEELYIYENEIQNLPKNIFKSLHKLKELHLNSNHIRTLHSKIFSGLLKLEELYLHQNEIVSLPENIFSSSTELRELYLFKNKIEILPKNLFAKNLNLEIVYVWGNNLKFIDINFEALPKISFLDLGKNDCFKNENMIFNSTEEIHARSLQIIESCQSEIQ